MQSTVLIISDAPPVSQQPIWSSLTERGHRVEVSSTDEALHQLRMHSPDLLILANTSGFDLALINTGVFQNRIATFPTVALWSEPSSDQRLAALRAGVDDVLNPTTEPVEFALRLESMMRRHRYIPTEIKIGHLIVDWKHQTVDAGIGATELTSTEFRLLAVLIERVGIVQDRTILLRDVWGVSERSRTRTLDTHIKRLREKLYPHAKQIETVRGVGYKMTDEVYDVEAPLNTTQELTNAGIWAA